MPRAFQQAFHLMRSGRPGPVLIDLPIDVQLAEIDFDPDTGKTTEVDGATTLLEAGEAAGAVLHAEGEGGVGAAVGVRCRRVDQLADLRGGHLDRAAAHLHLVVGKHHLFSGATMVRGDAGGQALADLPRRILRDLAALLKRDGFGTVAEAVGTANR